MRTLSFVVAFSALANALSAQTPALVPPAAADSAARRGPAPLRPLRIAKWTVLAGSAAAGIWGFVRNERADKLYRELEQACQSAPLTCRPRTAGGAYTDAALEARYQEVRSLDRQSHVALLAGQVGVAASVVLFLLDLGNVRPPPDIPYVPKGVALSTDAAGRTRIALRVPLGKNDAPN
jgi:hypothetical protein